MYTPGGPLKEKIVCFTRRGCRKFYIIVKLRVETIGPTVSYNFTNCEYLKMFSIRPSKSLKISSISLRYWLNSVHQIILCKVIYSVWRRRRFPLDKHGDLLTKADHVTRSRPETTFRPLWPSLSPVNSALYVNKSSCSVLFSSRGWVVCPHIQS